MKKPLIIRGPTVHTESESQVGIGVYVQAGRIQAFLSADETKTDARLLEFPASYHLIPGMIDMHIHGANGADVMDATPAALETIAQALLKEGTTAFLATTMTEKPNVIQRALESIKQFMTQQSHLGAEILGIHLEGPFINPEKMGAQNPNAICHPDIKLFEEWQRACGNQIKLVTVAPELAGMDVFIPHLVKKGIIVALGHTNAGLLQARTAIEQGVSYATHLFNAMSGLYHQEPGAALAVLLDERVLAELIADGVHLHPDIIRLTLQVKSSRHLVLVTDGMRAKCCPEGEFELGGQVVIVKNGVARLQRTGALAGSVLKMNEALKNMLLFTECSMQDVIAMTSHNPAKKLGLFADRGSIAIGKVADLVVLDENYEVVATLRQGEVVYHNE